MRVQAVEYLDSEARTCVESSEYDFHSEPVLIKSDKSVEETRLPTPTTDKHEDRFGLWCRVSSLV